jgi:uncharacterized membrane protein (Fun14 family)
MTEAQETRRESLPWRRRLVVLLLLVAIASVAWRVRVAKQERGDTPRFGTQLVAGAPEQSEPPPPTAKEKVLGYATEISVGMLIGLILGIATTALIKTVAVLFVLGIAGLQFYAYKTGTHVDWGAAGNWLREFVFHLSEGRSLGQVAADKLPATGALVIGYLLGLKRG